MRLSPVARSGLLLAILLSASAGVATLWFDGDGNLVNMTWARPSAIPAVISQAVIKEPVGTGSDRTLFTEISDRSMFAVDRRLPPPPPPPKPPAPPPPPDPLAGAKVFGLLLGDDGMALLRAEGKMLNLKMGGKIGAWQLKAIEERSATFVRGEKDEETRTLRLEYAKLGVPVARAVSGGKVNPMTGLPIPVQQGPAAVPESAGAEAQERARRRSEIRSRMGQ